MPQPSFEQLAFRQCRASLVGGSRSFFVASLLLPGTIARRATALYAFCRLADDLVDKGGDKFVTARLHARLDAIYAGAPCDHPADIALAATLREFRLPRSVFDALIEGFVWDLEGRQYQTLRDLQDYAARVAGTVGIMMSLAMDRTDADVLARAADLGVAMQLTNIARDVGEDARAGRLYLPREWLIAEHIDPDAFLAQPRFSPGLGRVVARLLDEAAILYRRADAGIAELPQSCRFGIGAARRLYSAIGDAVARNGFDSVTRRAVVPWTGKALVVMAGSGRPSRATLTAPVLPANSFLVATAMSGEPVRVAPAPWWDFPRRLVGVIEIFERLGQAERAESRRTA